MQKLELHHGEMLKGEFSLKELNFLFVFQVNCPGCFIYGIPAVNSLYAEFGDVVSFLGVSTAFEDFDFNTRDHTQTLLDSGQMIGETNKYFAKQGYTTYPLNLDFPIAMDQLAGKDFDLKKAANQICLTNPNFLYWSKFDQQQLQTNVIEYLKAQGEISLTFTLNQMRGTPSFIVFNKQMEILSHDFGHQSVGRLKEGLGRFVLQNN